MSKKQKDIENEKKECEQLEIEPAAQPDAQNAAPQPTEEEKRAERETELIQELAKTKDMLLRTAAEFDNYRKRSEKEKLGSVQFGQMGAIEKLLPALDALELAATAKTADEGYKKGVELTLSMFLTALQAIGVTEMDALGKPFNPELYSAVAQIEKEGCESGTVAEVMQKGYVLGDRVIRHAMVSVAK